MTFGAVLKFDSYFFTLKTFYFFSTALCLALSDGLSSTYDLPVARRFTLDVPNHPLPLPGVHS